MFSKFGSAGRRARESAAGPEFSGKEFPGQTFLYIQDQVFCIWIRFRLKVDFLRSKFKNYRSLFKLKRNFTLSMTELIPVQPVVVVLPVRL